MPRLESVPEMNYDALDKTAPKGELLMRGPMNFSGYYKDQVRTPGLRTCLFS